MSYRVLHVLDHSWPVLDGYSQRSRSIVTAQSQLGMQPRVVTGPSHQEDDAEAVDLSLDGIRYFRTFAGAGIIGAATRQRWPVLRELAIMRLLRKRIEELLSADQFDILHAHSPALSGLAALRAARSRRIPFVYEIRSFWEDSAVVQAKTVHLSMRYRLGRQLETFVVRRADAIVGISKPILEELEARRIRSAKLFHVPNGVDVQRFTPRPPDAELAAELGVAGIPTLGYLGTLYPWEGIPWVVRAAAELRRSGAQFKMLIVGDGIDASEVRKAIREANAEEYVSFLGRVPNEEVERYYSVMDFLIYPRRNVRTAELVTPLKPLEAMAQGKAVLGSSVGGIRELIDPEVSGLLFEPENTDDFCRKAARLLQGEDLRRSLGDRARQKIAKEKDWKVLACRYKAVYDAAIENARLRT